MAQTTRLVELTDEEILELIHALDFTAGESCELSNLTFTLINKLEEIKNN